MNATQIRYIDLAAENAFFLNQLAESHPEIIEQLDEDAGGDFEALGIDEQTPMLQMHKAKLRRIHAHDFVRPNWFVSQSMRHGRLHKLVQWFGHLRGQMKIMAMAFDISEMKEALWSYFQNQVSLYIVPALAMSGGYSFTIMKNYGIEHFTRMTIFFLTTCLSLILSSFRCFAAFFYYRLGNPSFDFLPTDASISWWILFAVRSYLTLTLAFITEYLFVDILATRSPLSVLVVRVQVLFSAFHCFIPFWISFTYHLSFIQPIVNHHKKIGPLATLYTINAKGWPFVITLWGVWNFGTHVHFFNTTSVLFCILCKKRNLIMFLCFMFCFLCFVVLLHGQAEFNNHWLFFTNIEMFTGKIMFDGFYIFTFSSMYIHLQFFFHG